MYPASQKTMLDDSGIASSSLSVSTCALDELGHIEIQMVPLSNHNMYKPHHATHTSLLSSLPKFRATYFGVIVLRKVHRSHLPIIRFLHKRKDFFFFFFFEIPINMSLTKSESWVDLEVASTSAVASISSDGPPPKFAQPPLVSTTSQKEKRSSHFNCCVCPPYGLFLLTVLYMVAVWVFEYAVPIECLHEPCSSEGVDTSVQTFGSDFLVGVLLILFALHLQCRSKAMSAQSAMWSMGFAFVFTGMGHSINSNSGFDDNKAGKEFYITWALSSALMMVSVEEIYRWSRKLAAQRPDLFPACSCFSFLHFVTFFAAIVAWLINFGAYVWCATNESIQAQSGVMDDVAPIENPTQDDLHMCIWMASTLDVFWWLAFSVFCIPTAIVFHRVLTRPVTFDSTSKNGSGVEVSLPPTVVAQSICGLSNSWAVTGLVLVPWTFGAMFYVWMEIISQIVGDDDLFQTIHGTVIVNYGMLVTYYLFHNLAWSLEPKLKTPVEEDTDEEVVEEDYDFCEPEITAS